MQVKPRGVIRGFNGRQSFTPESCHAYEPGTQAIRKLPRGQRR